MADMAAPSPGQFDAQATGLTAASGSASQSLEGELHALEQQLAELQVSFAWEDNSKRCACRNAATMFASDFLI